MGNNISYCQAGIIGTAGPLLVDTLRHKDMSSVLFEAWPNKPTTGLYDSHKQFIQTGSAAPHDNYIAANTSL